MFSIFICNLISPLLTSPPHSWVPEIRTWTSLGEPLFWLSRLSILIIGWPVGILELRSMFQTLCFPPCHNSYLEAVSTTNSL